MSLELVWEIILYNEFGLIGIMLGIRYLWGDMPWEYLIVDILHC